MAAEDPVLDQQTALGRLYPLGMHLQARESPIFKVEENLHPWRSSHFQPLQQPLLRIWDSFSGSQPTNDGRMLTRAPEMRLDDADSRRSTLEKHLDHKDWTAGPYVSFTTSPGQIESLVRYRLEKRGTQTLTVIDPGIRIERGLPILDVMAEMAHYQIRDPYGKSNLYYENHYVCLWQVTTAEIVGHWPWDSLVHNRHNQDWYTDIILPAFNKFTAEATLKPAEDASEGPGPAESGDEDVGDLEQMFDHLSVNDDLDHPGSSVSDGELYYSLERDDDWDTDDEAEEANAIDDMFKIIEGDW